jgi:3-dehydroquinate synthase
MAWKTVGIPHPLCGIRNKLHRSHRAGDREQKPRKPFSRELTRMNANKNQKRKRGSVSTTHRQDCLTGLDLSFLAVKKIPFKLKHKAYDVMIGAGLLALVGGILGKKLPSRSSSVVVVTSPTVRRHWGEQLENSLKREGLRYCILEMNDGEPAKRLHTVEQLAEQMVGAGADRETLLVAFGGGVVGDSAGFLASIFMRGLPVVQIPTTVLAQVDASIGGKTGVNLQAGKNLIGTFHQPVAVLVDPEILRTLDEREFRAGLFESLKCGVIRDRGLFEFMVKEFKRIHQSERKALERVIVDSIRVKAGVVAADERESGLRRILNFGHTIGHALESATGYTQLLHGEAVALGMIAATEIAREIRLCPEKVADEILSAIRAYGPLPKARTSASEVMSRLVSDKKTVAGKVHFVLPVKIGKVKIVSGVGEAVVERAVRTVLSP